MTHAQLALLHLAKRQLKLHEDDYRAILKSVGGVESAKQLDAAGFEAVMRYFHKCGFESTWRKRNYGDRAGMASMRQLNLIRELWREYTGADDEAALNKWLVRTCKASALRFLTPGAARTAITGLKTMLARQADSNSKPPLAG
jgi:hypothetical protein